MKKVFIVVLLGILFSHVDAQELLVPLNDDYEMSLQSAAYNSSYRFHTAMKSWSEYQFNGIIDIDSLNESQYWNVDFNKKWKKMIWDSFINKDFIRVKGDDFYLAVNPIIDFEIGKDNDKSIWVNTRGAEVKGTIGKNFAFYSNVRENQAVFPDYIDAYCVENKVIPGQGYTKRFKETGFDFTNASAYISLRPVYWLNATLGYGKNFIGDGYRSLILSDNAFSYPYLKLTANVWNIQYTCLYSQMTDRFTVLSDNTYARKFTIIHFLDYAVTKRLNIGVFDAMVCRGQNDDGIRRGFDFQYINPIIFLRSTDYYAGASPDNALMGLNMSFILGKHTTLYGQFVLDEMTVHEFVAGTGYYANKQAYQFGVKSYNCFGVKNLFLQGEFNLVRPYMYSHYTGEDNYAHHNQPLAHPWGANLCELVLRAQYNYKRFYLQYKMNYGQWGDDVDTLNYGHNIYLDYRDYAWINGEEGRYGHYMLTGEKNILVMNNFVFSWLVNPSYNMNVFAEITHRYHSVEKENVNDFIFSVGIRTSLDRKYYDF